MLGVMGTHSFWRASKVRAKSRTELQWGHGLGPHAGPEVGPQVSIPRRELPRRLLTVSRMVLQTAGGCTSGWEGGLQSPARCLIDSLFPGPFP